jgi:hypothetical protein
MENVAQGLGMPEIPWVCRYRQCGRYWGFLADAGPRHVGRRWPQPAFRDAQQTYQVPAPRPPSSGGGLAEVDGGGLDASEPIMLNLGATDLGGSAPIEFEFKRAEADAAPFSSPSASSGGGGGGLCSTSRTPRGLGLIWRRPRSSAWIPRWRW